LNEIGVESAKHGVQKSQKVLAGPSLKSMPIRKFWRLHGRLQADGSR
jgi:hypothetical protein